MAVIEKLDILLGARTNGFTSGIAGAEARVTGLRHSVTTTNLAMESLESLAGATDEQALAQSRWNRETRRSASLQASMNEQARIRNQLAREFGRTRNAQIPREGRLTAGRELAVLGRTHAMIASIVAAGASLKQAVDVEQGLVTLEVLSGNARDAQRLMQEIRTLSARTPLTFDGTQRAVRTMMLFNVQQGEVMTRARQLGDITGGNTQRMQQLALAFGQATAAGRLQGQDLRQMIDAGFNPMQTIAARTGETLDQVRDRLKELGSGADLMNSAFDMATGSGGRFEGMLDRMSDTLGGRLSIMLSQVQVLGAEMGQGLAPPIIEISELLQDWKPLLDGAVFGVKTLGNGLGFILALVRDIGNNLGVIVMAFKDAANFEVPDWNWPGLEATNEFLDRMDGRAEKTKALVDAQQGSLDQMTNSLGTQADLMNDIADASERAAAADATREGRAAAALESQQQIAKAIEESTFALAKLKFGADIAEQLRLSLDSVDEAIRQSELQELREGTGARAILNQIRRPGVEQLAQLQQQIGQLKALKDQAQDLDKQARDIRQKFATPQQQLTQELNRLTVLYRTGRISFQQMARAGQAFTTKLQNQTRNASRKLNVGFAERGSQEALRAGNRAQENVMEALASKRNGLAAQTNHWLRMIHQALQNGGIGDAG